jgi:hypothetical protein
VDCRQLLPWDYFRFPVTRPEPNRVSQNLENTFAEKPTVEVTLWGGGRRRLDETFVRASDLLRPLVLGLTTLQRLRMSVRLTVRHSASGTTMRDPSPLGHFHLPKFRRNLSPVGRMAQVLTQWGILCLNQHRRRGYKENSSLGRALLVSSPCWLF